MAERRVRQVMALGKRSLAVTIPSEFVDSLKLKAKDSLIFELDGNKMVVQTLESAIDGKPQVKDRK